MISQIQSGTGKVTTMCSSVRRKTLLPGGILGRGRGSGVPFHANLVVEDQADCQDQCKDAGSEGEQDTQQNQTRIKAQNGEKL
jgi:hypothetical protein